MNTPSKTSRSGSCRPAWIAALLVLGFAVLYAFTAQRGVSWGDSGMFQRRIVEGDLVGRAGLALAHPLYISLSGIVSRLVPSSRLLWFLNAMSGFWGALAVGGIFACALRFTDSLRAATLAAVSLGFAHMFWWLSTMSEVYTLSTFLLACETYGLLTAIRRRASTPMVFAFLANGIHFSVHNFALLSFPVHVAASIWLVRQLPAGRRAATLAAIAACGGLAWLAGSFPITSLALARYRSTGALGATVVDVLAGRYGSAVAGSTGVPVRITLFNYALAGMSFALPCFIASCVRRKHGARLRLKPESIFLACLFAIHFIFWIRYRVADQATFLLPTLFLSLVLLSPRLAGIRRPLAWCMATAATAVAIPNLVVLCIDKPTCARNLPFRDDIRYFGMPWKHDEDSAMRFIEAARDLPDNAFVYVDPTVDGALACARKVGLLPPTLQLSTDPPSSIPPSSRWEVSPDNPRYRLSPSAARIEKHGVFYKVFLP